MTLQDIGIILVVIMLIPASLVLYVQIIEPTSLLRGALRTIHAMAAPTVQHVMSRFPAPARPAAAIAEAAHTPAATTIATTDNVIATLQNDGNTLLRAKADALAAILAAIKRGDLGADAKLTETKGIELVFGCRASGSSETYQAARAALNEALARQRTGDYPHLRAQRRPRWQPKKSDA